MSYFVRLFTLLSCLSTAVLLILGASTSPDLVRAETPPEAAVSTGANPIQALIGAWELVKKSENGGPQQPVSPGANTLMEFSEGGVVIVTKTHKDNPSKPDIRPATFSVDGNTMLITDDEGNTARCEYRIKDDTLALAIPDIHKEFFWRRVK